MKFEPPVKILRTTINNMKQKVKHILYLSDKTVRLKFGFNDAPNLTE